MLIVIARHALTWKARLAAVEKINDTDVLAEIAQDDEDYRVRRVAVKRVEDEDIMLKIIEEIR